jgi:hypothetical protein
VYGSFCNIKRAAKACKSSYIYQFGDHDPTGCLIPQTIRGRLYEFCEKYRCAACPMVQRIALTKKQIER